MARKISEDEIKWILSLDSRQAQQEIHKLTQNNKELEISQKAIRAEMTKLTAEGKGNSTEFQNLNKQLKANSKEISQNKTRIQEHTKALGLDNMSLKELRKRHKELQRELDGTSKKLNPNEWKRLNAELNDTADAMKKVGRETKTAGGDFDLFGNSLINMPSSGDGFKGMLSSIGTSVKALGKTLLGLMTNPVFLVIAGIAGIGAAFKFWFDYNKGLIEATKLTQQFTGKSGNDLKAYRNEVQAIADVYGKDFKEVLMSSNAVAKQFGVSQNEALGLVRDGFVSGADANGQYLENLKEYPTFFKEAGISASEFIAITSQTNKSGIFGDKGVDAIKEATLRLREMTPAAVAALDGIGLSSDQIQKDLANGSKSLFEVIQDVSGKLNELPANSKAVGTAIADIFGGPGEDAGLQYLKTLKDIDTNLDNVKASTGELGRLQEEQLRSQADLNNTISALFDQTGGTFERLTTGAKVFVNDGINSMIKGLISVINYFIDLYNESTVFVGAINLIGATMKSAVAIALVPLKVLFENIKIVGNILKSAFTLDWDGFKQSITDGISGFKDIFVNTGTDIANNFVDAINNTTKRNKINPITIPVIATESKNKKPTDSTNPTNTNYTPSLSKEEQKKFDNTAVDTLKKSNTSRVDGVEADHTRKKIELDNALSEQQISQEQHDMMMLSIDAVTAQARLQVAEQYLEDAEALELYSGVKKKDAVDVASKAILKAEADLAKARAKQSSALENMLPEFKDKFNLTNQEDELNLQLQVLEASYQARKQMAEENGKDINDLTAAYEQAKTNILQKAEDERQNARSQYGLMTNKEAFNAELEQLKATHKKGLLSEEEYQKARGKLAAKHYMGEMQSITSIVSGTVNAMQDAEMAAVDVKYDKQIQAAQGNAEEVERLENEKAQKKLDIEKKYADVQFAIKVSEILANTGLAIMTGFAQLGPIGGAIAAVMLGATGAMQIASANSERQKVKNMTLGGGGGGGGSAERVVSGFAEGGYTGDGGRYEVAGNVHKGEYVVAMPEMRNPLVLNYVRAIESFRRQRTTSNPLPDQGYADGGYVNSSGKNSTQDPDKKIMMQFMLQMAAEIKEIKKTPLKAYTLLSDSQAALELKTKADNKFTKGK